MFIGICLCANVKCSCKIMLFSEIKIEKVDYFEYVFVFFTGLKGGGDGGVLGGV